MEKILEVVSRKARIKHKCWHCLLPIEIGESYECTTGVSQGSFIYIRKHEACAKLETILTDLIGDDGLAEGDLRDIIWEEWYNFVKSGVIKRAGTPNFEQVLNDVKKVVFRE